MPIVIESVSLEKFLSWLDSQTSDFPISRQHVFMCSIATSKWIHRISFRGQYASYKRVLIVSQKGVLHPIRGKSQERAYSSSHIKLDKTKNIEAALDALKMMYNGLKDSDPLKTYLKNNCLYLLSLPGEKLISDKDIASHYSNYQVNSGNQEGHPVSYKGQSGLYVFESLSTGFKYIGSAVCLYKRFQSHLFDSVRPERGGDKLFYLSVRESG
jgi:hypothetical protein